MDRISVLNGQPSEWGKTTYQEDCLTVNLQEDGRRSVENEAVGQRLPPQSMRGMRESVKGGSTESV